MSVDTTCPHCTVPTPREFDVVTGGQFCMRCGWCIPRVAIAAVEATSHANGTGADDRFHGATVSQPEVSHYG